MRQQGVKRHPSPGGHPQQHAHCGFLLYLPTAQTAHIQGPQHRKPLNGMQFIYPAALKPREQPPTQHTHTHTHTSLPREKLGPGTP